MLEALLNGKYSNVLDELFISEKDDYMRLHSIILKDDVKESGYGSQIMNDIIEYADKNNKIVTLTASDSYGSAKGRLIKFYKRFGFVPNKGRNKDFRFQDTMIREPNTMNENTDKIKGGLADGMSITDIAKHHDVCPDELTKAYDKGIKVELEHTNDKAVAKEIARDHLYEDPKYYDKLETIEENEMPIIKRKIINTLREHVNIKIADENPESTIYFICKGNDPIGGVEIDNVSGSPTDDTSNIIDIRIAPKERPIQVITDAIPLIFRAVPTMNTLLIPTDPKNRDFWERAGANRIKNGLHAFERGH